jgi:very-short-patch-repair endonuclease
LVESAATPPGPAATIDRERVKAQVRRWQDRVLDLTRSNPLIGLNRSRAAKLSVTNPDARSLLASLLINEAGLRMPLVRRRRRPVQDSLLEPAPDAELLVEAGEVTFDAPPAELMRRLRRIYDNARTTLEERGVTTLYLTLGALRWRDEAFGDSLSPLWMVPCEFESKGPDAPLQLRAADEDPQLNPALEYYLRERHKVSLPALPEEVARTSLDTFLQAIRRCVEEQKWEVTEEVWLGTFSFESLVIYNDLRALGDTAGSHPVVAALAHASTNSGASESLPHDLDSLPTPSVVPVSVLPTDSSQLEALTLASSGRHVVVHGPPGTGKSQTIANLIADALTRNKKVLFVSAKMAALNVVFERLQELGLDRFCLEAHSTKAGKQKIVDELRRTLDAENGAPGDALERELHALLGVREDLNAYARALHAPRVRLGQTVFRANGRFAGMTSLPDVRGPLPWSDPLTVSSDDLDSCLRALEELSSSAPVFDRRHEHPWRGFVADRFGLVEQESLEAALGTIIGLKLRLGPHVQSLEHLVPVARDLALTDWARLRDVLLALLDCDQLPDDWWSESPTALAAHAETFKTASALCSELSQVAGRLNAVSDQAPATLFSLLAPLQNELAGWHAPVKPSYWRWRRLVQRSLRPGVRFSRDLAMTIHGLAGRAIEIQCRLDKSHALIEAHVGVAGLQNASALAAKAHTFTVAALFRETLSILGRDPVPATEISPEFRTAAKALLTILFDAGAGHRPAFDRLDTLWPEGFIGGLLASLAPLPQVAARAEALGVAKGQARDWVLFQRALARCASMGLAPFLEALGATSALAVARIFERRFLGLWLSAVLDTCPILGPFTEAKGQDLLGRFRSLDERVRQLAIARARSAASSTSDRVRAAQGLPSGVSEISILRYELQKKRRIKPLRKLFAEIPHVLQALKPCLLMSPISVSTYLKPEVFHFDLVVFDEASQLPTAEAVPAILRSTQVVVAGDPNQLPPTSFFQTSLESEDEDEGDGDTLGQVPLESLLDDSVAVVPVFRESYLRWHYRSRDERLIKFSNHYFYDNKLVTFPAASPGTPGQGIRFVHVSDGVYDRGRSRTNRREASAVARLAVEHFERFPDRSLGIVAMGISQKEAIEDAISEELATRPDLQPFFDPKRHEGYFVKSLENVQGDERDTMVVSVGYGRDAAGGLSMNFGPVNMEGGWRRLNVLVTRAKWECILVSSLTANALAGVNPNNRGAIALRQFLEFAERGGEIPAAMAARTEGETNEFEDAVRAALVSRGLMVDAQVGASRYRIDLAVRDREDQQRYILGVECDGITYHSSRTARDRDLLRQHVLQGMGWRIHRVWSTEWFHNPGQVVEGILRSVDQAEANPSRRPVWAPVAAPDPEPLGRTDPTYKTTTPPSVTRRYRPGVPYSLYRSPSTLARESLLDGRYFITLADTITQVVRAEAPIHFDFLLERLKALHDIQRAGSNVRANLDEALQYALRRGTIARKPHSQFYVVPGCSLPGFRTATETVKRPVEHISLSEIAQAALFLIEDQFGLVEESAPTAVARLFGIERLQGDSADVIRRVIDDLVTQGLLRRSGSQVHLV